MTNKIIGKYFISFRWILKLGILVSLFLLYLSIANLRIKPYLDIPIFLSTLFWVFVIFICSYHLLLKRKIILTEKNITITSPFGEKKYLNKNINGYKLRKYTYKDISGEQIILKVGMKYICIDSNSYTNYYGIRKRLQKEFLKLNNSAFRKFDFVNTLPRRIIFLLISLFFLNAFLDNNNSLEEEHFFKNIIFTELKLAQSPIEKSSTKRRTTSKIYYYEFNFQNYSDFTFLLTGHAYNLSKKNKISTLKRGDIIKIGGKSKDIISKVLSLEEPSFRTKHFNWDKINIYHVEVNNEVLVNAYDVAKNRAAQNNSSYPLLLLSLFFAIFIFPKNLIYESDVTT